MTDRDVFLQSTNRLYTLLEDLLDLDKQSLSFLIFIRNRSKAIAIKKLAKTFSPPPRYSHDPSCQSQYDDESSSRGHIELSDRRANGEIYLHIHTLSTFSNRLVLLTKGDLSSLDKPRQALATEKYYKTMSRQLNSQTLTPTLSESTDKIYFRLLLPFTDIFYFFVDDVRKFRPII